MGICRSTCTQSSGLEYYDVWRTEQPLRGGRMRPTMRDRAVLGKSGPARRHTKLWTCDRGCCSIRWKLDYADFQSYTKYAEISPYVVVQENQDGCSCVICRGLPEQFLQCRIDQLARGARPVLRTPSETDDEEEGEVERLEGLPRVPVGLPPMSPVA